MDTEKRKELTGALLLLLASAIWGCAFVAQSVAAEKVGPFTFHTARSLLGGLVLLPVLLIRRMRDKKAGDSQPLNIKNCRTLFVGGVLCGLALGVASCLQQIGIAYTTVGNAGFITAMYILIVPVFGLFLGRRAGLRVWGCVFLGVAALYLLSIKDGFAISKGDLWVLACAVAFSVHILLVDRFSPQTDGVALSCIQFFVAGLLSLLPMLIIDRPDWRDLLSAWLPIAYAGIFSSGVAYTCQVLGQKHTRPAVASLLMSFESVFAVLAGALILGEIPTLREGFGCVLMFVAIVLAQLPQRSKKKA